MNYAQEKIWEVKHSILWFVLLCAEVLFLEKLPLTKDHFLFINVFPKETRIRRLVMSIQQVMVMSLNIHGEYKNYNIMIFYKNKDKESYFVSEKTLNKIKLRVTQTSYSPKYNENEVQKSA